MEEKIPVSVVVLTKNEEGRIARCLDAVKWADELIVVDDESSDKTLEIVKKYNARVFVRKMDIEGKHRNWAYAQAKNTWVLSVDADEIVTSELKEEITRTLSSHPGENGFTIPRRNYIGDYWVKHGGWYPSPQLKLFRKEKFRYEEAAVHPRAFMDDPCGHLKSDLIHYSYRNLDDFLAKMNNHTTREAEKWLKQGKPMRLGRFLYRTVDRFLRTYLLRQGYKDGSIGLAVAFFAGLYQFLSYLKYRELVRKKMKVVFLDRDGVINKYPGHRDYVKSWEEFHFLPQVNLALKKLNAAGYTLFVASNQAGVAKGIYSQSALDLITSNMLAELAKSGVEIEEVYYCTHLQEDNCSCRKPKTGLVENGIAKLQAHGGKVESGESYFVGDSILDVQTGKGAGLKTILVFSGREKPENKTGWAVQPDFIAADLSQAVEIILEKQSR